MTTQISSRYINLIYEIRRDINLIYEIRRDIKYNWNIANVKGVYDKSLGYVNVKRIERFIQDNLN